MHMVPITGVARNFDWGKGRKMEKFCDVFWWRNGHDVTKMTS